MDALNKISSPRHIASAIPCSPLQQENNMNTRNGTNSSTSSIDLNASETDESRKEVAVACRMSLADAVRALGEHRHGGMLTACRNESVRRQKINALMLETAIKDFLVSAPYADGRNFFWVKFNGHSVTDENHGYLRLHESASTDAIYNQMMALSNASLENEALRSCGIATDGRRRQKATRIAMRVIGHTALIWYMATRTSDGERAIPAVSIFLRVAADNYALGGRDAVSVYRSATDSGNSIREDVTPVQSQRTPAVAQVINRDDRSPQRELFREHDAAEDPLIQVRLPKSLVILMIGALSELVDH